LFRFPSILIALLLAVSCFDIASGLEHWPFGCYPMYSLLYPKHFTLLRLYGVNDRGEFPMKGDASFPPFDGARVTDALARIPSSELPAALLNLLHLHNRTTPAKIRTLRLYSASWTLRPDVKGDEPPEQKVLVLEVSSFEH
jgi:hypothetical protein